MALDTWDYCPSNDLRKMKPIPPPVQRKILPKSEGPMEAVYRLWDDLDQIPLVENDRALPDLARGMANLLGADNVKWMAAVRVLQGAKAENDPLLGWRLRGSYDLVPEPEGYQKQIAWWFQRNNKIEPDFPIGLATQALIAGAGTFQVHQMRDGWIPFAEFRRSEHFRFHYTELGITDRIWVSFPLNANTESIFLVDRTRSRHFTKKETVLAGTILRGIRGFHRRLFLNRGLLIADKPLPPVSQRIVQQLLSGLSEKEIALSMGQAPGTTHKHISTIYALFGVKSRAALMSLWLGT